MREPTFPIPPSIALYIRQHAEDPDAACANLTQAVAKRRLDPVGALWLAWMHATAGRAAESARWARSAALQAPGSPTASLAALLAVEPGAWSTAGLSPADLAGDEARGAAGPDLGIDLDTLITRLSRASGKRIKNESADSEPALEAAPAPVEKPVNVRTVTMARIHEKQGRYAEALAIFSSISKKKYAADIERLKRLTADG